MKKTEADPQHRSDSGDGEALAVALFCLTSLGGSVYLIWHFYNLLQQGFRCFGTMC